jgi:hypothetical protein
MARSHSPWHLVGAPPQTSRCVMSWTNLRSLSVSRPQSLSRHHCAIWCHVWRVGADGWLVKTFAKSCQSRPAFLNVRPRARHAAKTSPSWSVPSIRINLLILSEMGARAVTLASSHQADWIQCFASPADRRQQASFSGSATLLVRLSESAILASCFRFSAPHGGSEQRKPRSG